MSADDDEFDSPGGAGPSALPGGFRAAVTHALSVMGYAVSGWESDGVNVSAPGKCGGQYIGLANLYRRAKGAERADWAAMIRDFLEHVTGAISGPKIPDDLMTVAGQLRPRVGKPFARDARAYPWGIPLPGTGLEINLVIDYPHTMAYVTDDMLAKTGRAGEDLLDLALANLKADTPADFFERACEEQEIYVGHCGDGYDAARALLVEDLLPESQLGFWVAIPTREEAVAWPVSLAALERIDIIKLFAQGSFQDHAYPVTDEVFWLWNGMWYPFGIQIDDTGVTVDPPPEFLAALAGPGP
jgi:hypothetical protein